MLNISYAQLNYRLGDIAANVEKIQQTAIAAAAANSDLVVFSELALSGYFPADVLRQRNFNHNIEQGIQQLLNFSRQLPELYLALGAALPAASSANQSSWHNSLLVLHNGAIVLNYAKQQLANNHLLTEARYFTAGTTAAPSLTIKGQTIAFLIGDDCSLQPTAAKPLQQLQSQQIDLLISINADPSIIGRQPQRQAAITQLSQRHGFPILWLNQVGAYDQIIYDGGSFIANPSAAIVTTAASFAEQVGQFQLVDDSCSSATSGGEQLCGYAFIQQQLIFGLREYMRHCGFTKVVVGCSGGIDSALTIALAAQAIGAENVAAVTLPSAYSSAGSVTDSAQLCDNLGIQLDQFAIADLVSNFQQQFERSFLHDFRGLPLENLQSRLRGLALMAYSNQFGHLLLSTGNKSETAVGYCTLYGDTNGGLNLLGDLYKTEVFALANHLNQQAGSQLIPQNIISKEPSAELAPDQKDSDSLPSYAVLDQMLRYLLEFDSLELPQQQQLQATISDWQQDPLRNAEFNRVKHLIQISEYKRHQAAPILRLRQQAFGSGGYIPITAKYNY